MQMAVFGSYASPLDDNLPDADAIYGAGLSPSYTDSGDGARLSIDDSDNSLDREELEIALYSQVHFEANEGNTEFCADPGLMQTTVETQVPEGDTIVIDDNKSKHLDEPLRKDPSLKETNAVLDKKVAKKSKEKVKKKKKIKKSSKKSCVAESDKSSKVQQKCTGSKAYVSVVQDLDVSGKVNKSAHKAPTTAPLALLLTKLGALGTPGRSATYKMTGKSSTKMDNTQTSVLLKGFKGVKDVVAKENKDVESLQSSTSGRKGKHRENTKKPKSQSCDSIIVIGSEDDGSLEEGEIRISEEEPNVLTVTDDSLDEDSSEEDDADSLEMVLGVEPRTVEGYMPAPTDLIQLNVNNLFDVDGDTTLDDVHNSLEG